jgi:hypothetical protein
MEGPADERGDCSKEKELQTTTLCGHSSDLMPELAAVNDSSSDESSDEPADRPRPPPRQSPQPKKPVKKKPAKKKPKRKAAKRRGGQPGARRVYIQSCVQTCRRLTTGGDQEEPGEARFAELRKAIEASPKYWGDGSGGVSTFDLGRMFSTSLNFQESQWVNHDEGRPKRTDGP